MNLTLSYLIASASFAFTALANSPEFDRFKSTYNKSYVSADEEAHRFSIFLKNLEAAKEYQLAEQGSAKYGITQFMDLTPEEFKSGFLGYQSSGARGIKMDQSPDILTLDDPSIDWVTKGAVTPVKNQGGCGSCWAFSTTGNVEGQHFLKAGSLVSLSEQQLVDCDTKGQDQGCQGGLPSEAYKYIIANGGIDTEKSYGYTGRGGLCRGSSGTKGASISNWTQISKDEDQIAAQLVSRGPLSIGINAGPMQYYGGGVACPLKILCSPAALDHGVLIVGVGTDANKGAYWKIKNSWDTTWGEDGYYRICKGQGACGLNMDVTSAIV